MDISQYRELFITEAQEHLDYLNKFLLQLENDPGNLDVVTEIFRSAHTLKGMSATMGYDQLTELAHEMENLLEHLRTGGIPVTTLIVDTLFACFDTLEEIINAIAQDRPEQVDYGALVTEMKGIIGVVPAVEIQAGDERRTPLEGAGEGAAVVERGAGKESYQPGPSTTTLLQVADEDLATFAAIPGMRVLGVTVELDRECLLKSVRVFMVFKKLAQLGEVLASLPPVEALEDEKFDLDFQVGLATSEVNERVVKALLAIAEISKVTVDVIREADVARPEEMAPARAPTGRAATLSVARRTQSVRVNIARLDSLMNLVGELVINRTRLISIASGIQVSELHEALDHTTRLTSELQDEIMKTRMVPVEHIFNRFPRMVRDLAKAEGKEVDFIVEGKEIELDRTILDEISDPLMHMIRNAVDHGIATPEERESKGRPRRGIVRLSAYRDRNYVAIEVEDDGDGIDPAEAFDRAAKKGLISPEERASLDPGDILRVISMPGLSMSEEVSGVSGRGMGMDAVKSKAESLGGFVSLDTSPGLGTRVTLKLPLTLAIVHALMVEVAGEVYALPLGTVRETHVLSPDDIKTIQNREAIFLRDETIPLLRLDRALGCSRSLDRSQPFPVVITEVGPRLVAIGVHSLIGQQEIVISSLDEHLKRVDGFAGATILGTGRVALILDIPGLMST